jgi:hypothetical protein
MSCLFKIFKLKFEQIFATSSRLTLAHGAKLSLHL